MSHPIPTDQVGLLTELELLGVLRRLFPTDLVLNELFANAADAAMLLSNEAPPSQTACDAMGYVIRQIWSRFEVLLIEPASSEGQSLNLPERHVQAVSSEIGQIAKDLTELDRFNSPLYAQLKVACEDCRRTGKTDDVERLLNELKASESKSEALLNRLNKWYANLGNN